VRGDVLDLILIVVVAAFAVSGYRQGFIVGVLSFFGFVGGALVGYGLGLAFGLSIFEAGYSNGSIVAIVLVGLGGGMGLQLARRWRASRQKDRDAEA